MSFHPDGSNPPDAAPHLVRIPPSTEKKQDLLRVLSTSLKFPSYFGFNWDALDECLADLSWLRPGEVHLWHEGVPLSSQPAELGIYLNLLHDVKAEQQGRPITISFPESCKETILGMLR